MANKVADFVDDVTADSISSAQADADQALTNAAVAQTTANTALTNAATAQAAADNALTLVANSPHERVFTSPLGRSLGSGTSAAQSGVAYWVYVKKVTSSITVQGISYYVSSTPGTGSQTAELALASSSAPPNRGAQTLTKLWAASVSADLTSSGAKRQTLSQVISGTPASPVYLWVGFRQVMSGTQAQLVALAADFGDGLILATSSAGALTNAGPWTGVVLNTPSNAAQCPDLHVTLD